MNVLDIYKQAGGYHEGHFLLASGRHAAAFLQSTTVMQHPAYTEKIAEGLAACLQDTLSAPPDFVVGPAMGGVVLAYEVARQLGCRAIFAEKDGAGGMKIREAFEIKAGERFVAVEDVITTGGSLRKSVDVTVQAGASLAAGAVIIDRRPDTLREDWPLASLLHLPLASYPPEDCPLCADSIPLEEI